MNISCDIEIDLENKNKAETVLKSVKVDDFDFVTSKIEGKKLVANIKSDSLSSLIHTLDDYLACVSVAVKVVDKN